MKKLTIITFGLLLTLSASAKRLPQITPDFSRFEQKTEITVKGIVTPKVIKYITSDFNGGKTLLINSKTKQLVAHKWIRSYEKTKRQNFTVKSVSSSFEGNKQNLTDNNFQTYLTFDPEQNNHKITLNFSELTEVSGIYLLLDSGIITPQNVSIRGDFGNGKMKNIIKDVYFSRRISFPKVSVKNLEISLKSRHFLRITDINISGQEKSEITDELIFFAREGASYTLYSKPHFGQKTYRAKSIQPLNTEKVTPKFSLKNFRKNSQFNPDFDRDGLDDYLDFCPKISDSKNLDIDNNGRGDVCEDPDQDNINSHKDNCPFVYNPDQADKDLDKIGDKCDEIENRASENSEIIWYVLFGFGALSLGFLVWRSLKPNNK